MIYTEMAFHGVGSDEDGNGFFYSFSSAGNGFRAVGFSSPDEALAAAKEDNARRAVLRPVKLDEEAFRRSFHS